MTSPFAFKTFVGRTLCHRKSGEAYRIVGYVGSLQFIVEQDGSDVQMFIPIKNLHKYVMLPVVTADVSDDELACA